MMLHILKNVQANKKRTTKLYKLHVLFAQYKYHKYIYIIFVHL